MVSRSCVVCGGDRLSDPMRSVKVAGRTLPEICRLSAVELLESLDSGWSLSDRDQVVAKDTLGELRQRLHQVVQLGLGHLHLDRATASLSSGERQRLRVARQLAAPLTGCVYVLDEPTLGLHARDTDALLQALKNLVAHGNAVVAVEHDMRVVAAADHVMEVGPGAGGEGGRLVASGPPTALPEASRAGRHLQRKGAELRSEPRYPSSAAISVRGANLHCLDNIDVTFPAGCLTAVTGVSGSGKTTLVRGVLGASSNAGVATGCRELSGLSAFDAVVDDAEARARRTRSGCVATLLGVYDEIRKQFAGTDAAREQGWRAGHFSYLGKNGGACKACGGLGWLRSDLDFLGADAWSVCEQCAGRRFDDETLAIAWLGMSIADVLGSTVDQLAQRIGGKNTDHMRSRLDAAQGHGLGYLRLGQSADSLSGGEAQRVSLAFHIASRSQGPSLLLLDEPTRGLHPDDVGQLLVTFEKLLEDGHTIIAIEHDMSLIAASDYVVDLGPEAGAGGGQLVAEGTPAELATLATSITGQALRDYVSGLPD
jgi:excinuclease ABC subunit A